MRAAYARWNDDIYVHSERSARRLIKIEAVNGLCFYVCPSSEIIMSVCNLSGLLKWNVYRNVITLTFLTYYDGIITWSIDVWAAPYHDLKFSIWSPRILFSHILLGLCVCVLLGCHVLCSRCWMVLFMPVTSLLLIWPKLYPSVMRKCTTARQCFS